MRAQDVGRHRRLRCGPDVFALTLFEQLAIGLDHELPETDDRIGDEVGRAPLQEHVFLC